MVVNLEIEFHESEIPPRCHKPRMVGYKDVVKVKIAEVTDKDAPIAFMVHDLKEAPTEVRTYRGQLYKEARISFYNGKELEEYAFENIPWQSVLSKYSPPGTYTTKAEYVAYLKVESRKYLIVDNTLYINCHEPYYQIITFGCHGDGTAIFPQFSDKSRKELFGYSAKDKDKAIADAISIAKSRGDEEYIGRISNLVHGTIEVLKPELCKRKFKPQI